MNGSDHDSTAPLLPVQDPAQRSTGLGSFIVNLFTLKNFFILLGPLLCAVICATVKFNDGGGGSTRMLAVLVWVFTWWLTEAVPMPVTSMSPLFLFPLFGISSSDDVAKSYMDDVISLVLGSFILALAVEHYNIHRRLALNEYSWSESGVGRRCFVGIELTCQCLKCFFLFKLDHLKSIAQWAETEAYIPSLGALFGQRLAATTEALGVRNDPSFFLCERCRSL